MNHVFVVNPHAGKGNNETELRNKIKAAGIDAHIHVTAGRGDGVAFVRQWCETHPGENRFYACGGDGTLNEVVNGAAGMSGASVYPYPCGSGNDFVKYYGAAEDFLDLSALADAEEVTADLIKVGDKYAVNVANFGFDAAVCCVMEEVRHKPIIGGKNSYTTGIIRALLKNIRNKCTVWVDGEQLNDAEMLLCTAANGKYVGGKYLCAPRSDNTDGLLEICFVNPISRVSFIRLINYYKRGEHLDPRFSEFITYRRGKKVRVEAHEGFTYCLDGEVNYSSSFEVEIVPGGITLAVPKKLAPKKEKVTANL